MYRALLASLFALSLTFAVTPQAHAQASVPIAKAQLKEAKQVAKGDKKDLKTIAKLRKQWEQARAKGNRNGEGKADVKIAAWVRTQLDEGRVKVARAEALVTQHGGTVPERGAKIRNPATSGGKKLPPAPGSQAHARAAAEKLLYDTEVDQRRLVDLGRRLGDLQPKFTAGTATGEEYGEKATMLQELQRHAGREYDRATKAQAAADLELQRAKGRR